MDKPFIFKYFKQWTRYLWSIMHNFSSCFISEICLNIGSKSLTSQYKLSKSSQKVKSNFLRDFCWFWRNFKMVLLFSLRSVLSKNFNSSIWHGDSVTNSNTWFSEPFKAKTCKVFNVSFKWANNDDNSDFKIQLYVMYNSEIMEYLKDFKHVVKEEVKSWFCTGIPADLVVFSSKNWYLKKVQFEWKLILCSKHTLIKL